MAEKIRLFTIGFTQKTAQIFFETLRNAGVRSLIDIRLRNTSQMAGFTKRDDLDYFMRSILQADYTHMPLLAPSEAILDAYKQDHDWERYQQDFLALLRERCVSKVLAVNQFRDACLLCSEPTPEKCHRRVVAEHLRESWRDVEIRHL
jgi:uncharacterized protein (DUF488 family)